MKAKERETQTDSSCRWLSQQIVNQLQYHYQWVTNTLAGSPVRRIDSTDISGSPQMNCSSSCQVTNSSTAGGTTDTKPARIASSCEQNNSSKQEYGKSRVRNGSGKVRSKQIRRREETPCTGKSPYKNILSWIEDSQHFLVVNHIWWGVCLQLNLSLEEGQWSGNDAFERTNWSTAHSQSCLPASCSPPFGPSWPCWHSAVGLHTAQECQLHSGLASMSSHRWGTDPKSHGWEKVNTQINGSEDNVMITICKPLYLVHPKHIMGMMNGYAVWLMSTCTKAYWHDH